MTNASDWFVVTNSCAAPFFSDKGQQFVQATTARAALEHVAANYSHPYGLFAAAAWPSSDAMHKGEPAAATWLCNHEAERKRLTEGLHAFTYRGHGPGDFEIDGKRHRVKNPKAGGVIDAKAQP